MTGKVFQSISQEIARQWGKISPEGREHFEALALEVKRLHKLEYPNYRYAPVHVGKKKPKRRRRNADEQGDMYLTVNSFNAGNGNHRAAGATSQSAAQFRSGFYTNGSITVGSRMTVPNGNWFSPTTLQQSSSHGSWVLSYAPSDVGTLRDGQGRSLSANQPPTPPCYVEHSTPEELAFRRTRVCKCGVEDCVYALVRALSSCSFFWIYTDYYFLRTGTIPPAILSPASCSSFQCFCH